MSSATHTCGLDATHAQQPNTDTQTPLNPPLNRTTQKQVTFPLQGSEPSQLQALLDACSPAMHGEGRETVHNEAVRKALQLRADRLGIGLSSDPLPPPAVLAAIGQLAAAATGPRRAEPLSQHPR